MEKEFETKSLINEKDFLNIINKYKVEEMKHQVNYYFDTKNEYFKNKDSALRIRALNNTYTLTLKIKKDTYNEEYNNSILQSDFHHILENKKLPKKFTQIDDQVDLIAIIDTKRYIIKYHNHYVEIDETVFNDTVDYEIEIESNTIENANLTLDSFLKENNIPFTKSSQKISRYFEYNKKNI